MIEQQPPCLGVPGVLGKNSVFHRWNVFSSTKSGAATANLWPSGITSVTSRMRRKLSSTAHICAEKERSQERGFGTGRREVSERLCSHNHLCEQIAPVQGVVRRSALAMRELAYVSITDGMPRPSGPCCARFRLQFFPDFRNCGQRCPAAPRSRLPYFNTIADRFGSSVTHVAGRHRPGRWRSQRPDRHRQPVPRLGDRPHLPGRSIAFIDRDLDIAQDMRGKACRSGRRLASGEPRVQPARQGIRWVTRHRYRAACAPCAPAASATPAARP